MLTDKAVREQAELLGLRLWHPRGIAHTKVNGRRVRVSPYTLLSDGRPLRPAVTGKGLQEIVAYLASHPPCTTDTAASLREQNGMQTEAERAAESEEYFGGLTNEGVLQYLAEQIEYLIEDHPGLEKRVSFELEQEDPKPDEPELGWVLSVYSDLQACKS